MWFFYWYLNFTIITAVDDAFDDDTDTCSQILCHHTSCFVWWHSEESDRFSRLLLPTIMCEKKEINKISKKVCNTAIQLGKSCSFMPRLRSPLALAKCRFCFCLLSEPRKWICLFLRFDYYDLCDWMWLQILLQFTFYLFTHWNITYFAFRCSPYTICNFRFSFLFYVAFVLWLFLFQICVACAFEVMFNERFYCIVDDVVKYFPFITILFGVFFCRYFEKRRYYFCGINDGGYVRLLMQSDFWQHFDIDLTNVYLDFFKNIQ